MLRNSLRCWLQVNKYAYVSPHSRLFLLVDYVVGTTSTQANVVLKPSNSNTAVNAHQGDVIEVQLPFGQLWNGPTTSQGVLQLETPAGYASQTANSCIWRFAAQGTGTAQLNFYGRAICKKGALCPQYVMSLPFTINVN
jgi:hypothetical protein